VPVEEAYTGGVFAHEDGPIMNPRTPEVELPVVSEMQAEVPRIARRIPDCPPEASRTAQPERREARAAEERRKPRVCNEPGAKSFLFDDPYWDDAFDSYHDPTLRTCCRF
jgi:hypothetical protein